MTDTDEAFRDRLAVVDIIKAAACIMIFLYHCNTILPGEWKFLTLLGQDLGNNLFFMVSGFSLAPSIDRIDPAKDGMRAVCRWYMKRLLRILPITAIAYILTFFMGYYSLSDPTQLIAIFIYPTLYWFITAILIFYIILFFAAKCPYRIVMYMMCGLLAIMYTVLYSGQERLYVIGLLSMLAGYLLRERMIKKERSIHSLWPAFGAFVFFFVLFTAGKNAEKGYLSACLILTGVLGAGLALLTLGYSANDELSAFFAKRHRLYGLLRFIGDMALPVYLVQCFCFGYIGFTIGLRVDFPLSFLVNLIIVWTLGTLLYIVSRIVSAIVGKISKSAYYKPPADA
ncbi:MAG: acyltransferase family protein [Lachnospiraceae bacterium]|nr:acyltransferase family protein [Lachnospiraceae bacterium]